MGGRSGVARGGSGLAALRLELREAGDQEIAAHSARFFKTGPGEYGEGDRFRGIRVPVLRALARRHREIPLADLARLLGSEWHEDRLTALLILVARFERGDDDVRRRVYETYVAHLDRVNNWDLVDASAPAIVGGWLRERSRKPLERWAASPRLWERRIAVLATFTFIRGGELEPTFRLSRRLLGDPEDLIHKAVGWMLREAGHRERAALEAFLDEHVTRMPRTMLRYAIERLPPARRARWMRR